jgi:hypothetical protein
MLQRETRARPHLDFEPFRDRHREARRHGMARAGGQSEFLGGDDVEAGGARRRIGWKRQPVAMRQALDLDVDGGGHGVGLAAP